MVGFEVGGDGGWVIGFWIWFMVLGFGFGLWWGMGGWEEVDGVGF